MANDHVLAPMGLLGLASEGFAEGKTSLQVRAAPLVLFIRWCQSSWWSIHGFWYCLPSTITVLHLRELSITPGRWVDSSNLQIKKNRGPETFNNFSKVTQLVRGAPIVNKNGIYAFADFGSFYP